MLAAARTKAPRLRWGQADLADAGAHLHETFDLVALPGNVMIFVECSTEGRVIDELAALLKPGGLLVAGFQLLTGQLTLDSYDALAAEAGLERVDR